MNGTLEKNMQRVRELLDKPEIFCQLVEECDELGQAAMKLRRAITRINPTPMTEAEAWRNLTIEIADVMGCLKVLQIETDTEEIQDIQEYKMDRWVRRIEEERQKQARMEKMLQETEGES